MARQWRPRLVNDSGQMCNDCEEFKDLNDFYFDTFNNHRRTVCKKCEVVKSNARHVKHRKENPDYYRDKHLLRNYGITRSQYESMLITQGYKCAACRMVLGEPLGLYKYHPVDHCHITGKVRGIVHHNCNAALGYANDNPELLMKLAKYLLLS